MVNVAGDRKTISPWNAYCGASEMRVSQGFWETREHCQNIEGNKGTIVNFWEQGNKILKITVRKHSERVWEHGNIRQFWKGTREQGPPPPPPWETLRNDPITFLNTTIRTKIKTTNYGSCK